MTETASRSEISTNRRIIAVLSLSLLLASMGTSIANVALPALAQAFAAPFDRVRWVVIAYLAAMTLSVVVAGRLGDIHGRRRMFVAGLATYAASSLLGAIVPSLSLLIAARAVQGVAAAFLMTLALALARDIMGAAGTGRAMGMLGTVSAIGTALGPSLGGVLLATLGWRAILGVQVPVAVLALVLAVAVLPPEPARTGRAASGFTLTGTVVLLPGLLVNILVAAVMMTTLVVGPFFLGLGLGLGDAAVGLVMTVGPVLSILSGIPAGRMVEARGSAAVVLTGLALLSAGAFGLALLPSALGLWGYVLAVAVLTPGYQLFQAANNTAVLGQAHRDRRGLASGLLALSRNLGLVLGASVMAGVFAAGVGTADVAHATPVAIAGGLRLVFAVAGGMMLVAFAIAAAQARKATRQEAAGTAAAVEA